VLGVNPVLTAPTPGIFAQGDLLREYSYRREIGGALEGSVVVLFASQDFTLVNEGIKGRTNG
jgi:hypothetical protein